jgi:hypothetical protein
MSNVGKDQKERVEKASSVSGFQVVIKPAYDIRGRELKASIAIHAFKGGTNAKKFWEIYHDLPVAVKEPKRFKCQCLDIYEQGCKCGGE